MGIIWEDYTFPNAGFKTVVFGTPGAGKTHYIINKIKELVESGTSPSNIAYVVYNKEAAKEARQRLAALGDFPHIKTLHAFGFHLQEIRKEQMLKDSHINEFNKLYKCNMANPFTVDNPLGLQLSDSKTKDTTLVYNALHFQNPFKFDSSAFFPGVRREPAEVQKDYEGFKKENNIFDFNDLLQGILDKKITLDVVFVFIDEAQDFTPKQWLVLNQLFKNTHVLYICGDDDQNIYTWAGADVQFFLAQVTANCTTEKILLNKSKRLPYLGVLGANTLISAIPLGERELKFSAQDEELIERNYGCIQLLQNLPKSAFTENGETYFVLGRSNHIVQTEIVPDLRGLGLLYSLKDRVSVPEKVVYIIDKYKEWQGHSDPETFLQKNPLLKKFIRYPDNQQMHWRNNLSLPVDLLEYLLKCEKEIPLTMENYTLIEARCRNIFASTIHQVKGKEADNVVIYRKTTKELRDVVYHHRKGVYDEIRLWYVAITRTKKNLYWLKKDKWRNYVNFPVTIGG